MTGVMCGRTCRTYGWTTSPDRTSIIVQAESGNAAHQRSMRTSGLMGGRPRPEYSRAGTSMSRTNVFEGTDNR